MNRALLDPADLYSRSLSLPSALEVVARSLGHAIDHDALCAAMGLSFMLCCPHNDEPLCHWPMFARDAFLPEAARLFGMEIREIHPPEAAHGLSGMREFDQHFDASYKPLIRNALRHGQPVLAWRGWPDEHELLWGRIQHECAAGIGFAGSIFGRRGTEIAKELVLQTPPVQLYVVERTVPRIPKADELIDGVLKHARCVLHNELGGRFDVITGPQAYDEWIRRLDMASKDIDVPNAVVTETAALATAVMAGHRSATRSLRRELATASKIHRGHCEKLLNVCEGVVAALTELRDKTAVCEHGKTPAGRAFLLSRLSQARSATVEPLGTAHE